MTIEANKDLVKRTWQMLLGGNPEGALANFSDDVTWWINGKLDGVSGMKKGKEAVRAFLGGVTQAFPAGLKTEIKKAYGDGDTVIVELVNRGTSATGKAYENEGCFDVRARGRKDPRDPRVHRPREVEDRALAERPTRADAACSVALGRGRYGMTLVAKSSMLRITFACGMSPT